jgi:pyruvate/2-oxoglutarate dehydrogenase complex dihydrolipoamide dehydrogenase (E3) component
MPDHFDDLFIGAGQSGPFLAEKLASSGRRVALVERRFLGGTCVNDGCMPTKTMVASARAAWVVRNAARWGVGTTGEVTIDWPAVQARKNAVIAKSRGGLETWLGGTKNLEIVRGEGQFLDANTVVVSGDRTLTAGRIFLNTGCRPIVPPVAGLAEAPFLTSETIMDVPLVPRHLIVLGGSYVGLEFAQMFRRFGSAVTVVDRGDRIASHEDDDVSAELQRILAGEGIAFRLGVEAREAKASDGGVEIAIGLPGSADVERITGSDLLVAIGRAPSTRSLRLERAGVALDPRGYIAVDDELHTNVPHIFALGDVNGRGAFTHTSYDDFQIVAANLLGAGGRRVSQRIPIYALYVDPPLARCGMNVAEARASGRRVLIGRRPMSRVGRANERGETDGFMQVLVDADTRKILGATLLGIEADEAIHGIVDTMYADAPYDVLMRAVHAHPTVSELIPTVLESLAPLA